MQNKGITVSDLNKHIKNLVDADPVLSDICVCGEISNFKHHSTGHLYFTLKDESSSIKGVMFRGQAATLKFEPKDGMKVIIRGRVSVFERDGQYQIYIQSMMQDGVGDLYIKFEQLKEQLNKEGLFDPSKKKSIPEGPKTIGVITSPTGAVIRDIINVATSRFENINIKLLPCAVQGELAKDELVSAIKFFNKIKNVDVIIIGRGGGSIEDLWPFNEEIVARAIFESEIPIISAVGHETDFTICDFVADKRASTPSHAAELAVPKKTELVWKIENCAQRAQNALKKKIQFLYSRLERCTKSTVFTQPYDRIYQSNMIVDNLTKRLSVGIKHYISEKKHQIGNLASKLDSISPFKTIMRGYSLTMNSENKLVKKISDVRIDEEINVKLSDGILNCNVRNIIKEEF